MLISKCGLDRFTSGTRSQRFEHFECFEQLIAQIVIRQRGDDLLVLRRPALLRERSRPASSLEKIRPGFRRDLVDHPGQIRKG